MPEPIQPDDEIAMTPRSIQTRAEMAHEWAASRAPEGVLPWSVRQHFGEDMPKVIETLIRLAQEKSEQILAGQLVNARVERDEYRERMNDLVDQRDGLDFELRQTREQRDAAQRLHGMWKKTAEDRLGDLTKARDEIQRQDALLTQAYDHNVDIQDDREQLTAQRDRFKNELAAVRDAAFRQRQALDAERTQWLAEIASLIALIAPYDDEAVISIGLVRKALRDGPARVPGSSPRAPEPVPQFDRAALIAAERNRIGDWKTSHDVPGKYAAMALRAAAADLASGEPVVGLDDAVESQASEPAPEPVTFREDLPALRAALDAVLRLHIADSYGNCCECGGEDDPQGAPWPCLTVCDIRAALNGHVPAEDVT